MTEYTAPVLRVTLFTDYICPFCYIGDLRLNKLRHDYEVLVNFRFLEIHPDTPAAGVPVSTLDYSAEQWSGMMDGLGDMARTEGIKLAPLKQLANSHHALLLAEAAKESGREQFYALHQRLYEEYFLRAGNLGDQALLRTLASASGVSMNVVDRAWSDPAYEQTLKQNMQMAVQAAVTGTPTLFIGKQRLTGAVSTAALRDAAAVASAS